MSLADCPQSRHVVSIVASTLAAQAAAALRQTIAALARRRVGLHLFVIGTLDLGS